MSADPITHIAKLPHGFEAEFVWQHEPKQLTVRWSPDTPNIRSPRHRRKFFEAYTAARRDFMRDVATVIGGNVGIVDVPGDVTDGQVVVECVNPATKH